MSDLDVSDELRAQVLDAARSIRRLSHSDADPAEFFSEFLRLAIAAMEAEAGAVWLLAEGPQRRLNLITERHLASTDLRAQFRTAHRNQQFLLETLSTGQARLVAPAGLPSEFPSRHHLVVVPLRCGDANAGVVEFFLPREIAPDSCEGYQQFAERLCQWASEYLERRRAMQGEASAAEIRAFADCLLRMERCETLKDAAMTVACEGRAWLGCDRLSVILRHGRTVTVEAVSGHEEIQRRGSLLQRMKSLGEAAIESAQPVEFPASNDDIPPHVEIPLSDFVAESGTRQLWVVPLQEPPQKRAADDSCDGPEKDRPAFGCLVVERFHEGRLPCALRSRLELIHEHAAATVFQALQYDRIPCRALLARIGRTREWFRGRTAAKAAALLIAMLCLGFMMALVPWPYRVTAVGRLMPAEKRRVFAPSDGEVVRLFVQSGDRVRAGDPLLTIQNKELGTHLLKTRTELQEKRQLAESLRVRIDQAVRSADRRGEVDLQGQRIELLVQIQGLELHQRTLGERIEALTIRSPVSGIVATFQVEELLASRPVRRGEKLLEVMDDSGAWQLELEVPERRLGQLLRGQEETGTLSLGLDYVLASQPDAALSATLKTIACQAVPSHDHSTVVEVVAEIPADRMPAAPRIGAEVRARIACSTRSLGNVLFGDVIEFVRKWCWM